MIKDFYCYLQTGDWKSSLPHIRIVEKMMELGWKGIGSGEAYGEYYNLVPKEMKIEAEHTLVRLWEVTFKTNNYHAYDKKIKFRFQLETSDIEAASKIIKYQTRDMSFFDIESIELVGSVDKRKWA